MREIRNKRAREIINEIENKNSEYKGVRIYNTGNMYYLTSHQINGRAVNRIYGITIKSSETLEGLLN